MEHSLCLTVQTWSIKVDGQHRLSLEPQDQNFPEMILM
jgi:hypothetical protein